MLRRILKTSVMEKMNDKILVDEHEMNIGLDGVVDTRHWLVTHRATRLQKAG